MGRLEKQFEKDANEFIRILNDMPDETATQLHRLVELLLTPLTIRVTQVEQVFHTHNEWKTRVLRKFEDIKATLVQAREDWNRQHTQVDSLRAVLEDTLSRVEKLEKVCQKK